MTKRANWKKWAQPILVPAVVFIAVALILTVVTRQIRSLQEDVRHTQEVKDQLNDILMLLKDGETATRGYVLTGDKTILQPALDARERLEPALKKLEGLVTDNPVQLERMSALRPLVAERVAQLTAGRDIYAEGLVLPLPPGKGPETQARVRDAIMIMTAEEDRLLAERRESVALSAAYLQLLAYGTLFVVMTVAIFALSRARRRRDELEVAQAALRATGISGRCVLTSRPIWNAMTSLWRQRWKTISRPCRRRPSWCP